MMIYLFLSFIFFFFFSFVPEIELFFILRRKKEDETF